MIEPQEQAGVVKEFIKHYDKIHSFIERWRPFRMEAAANNTQYFDKYFCDLCEALDVSAPASSGSYCFNKTLFAGTEEEADEYFCDVWKSGSFIWVNAETLKEAADKAALLLTTVFPFTEKPPLVVMSARERILVYPCDAGLPTAGEFYCGVLFDIESLTDPEWWVLLRNAWNEPTAFHLFLGVYDAPVVDSTKTPIITRDAQQEATQQQPGIRIHMAAEGTRKNRYAQLIEDIFFENYEPGQTQVQFMREDIESTAAKLGIALPKNLGDVIYSFKFRAALPASIKDTATDGREWVIKNIGRSLYVFEQVANARITPALNLPVIKIPDATPGLVEKYAFEDEQSLLAKLRYNRLLDIFTGATCYSLQNHLRTTVPGVGQIETDEVYVGIDGGGRQYVFPLQAKGGKDELGIVQIEQDILLSKHKYPRLICRAIAAQFMGNNKIALFEFAIENNNIIVRQECHYQLVQHATLTEEDVTQYNSPAEV